MKSSRHVTLTAESALRGTDPRIASACAIIALAVPSTHLNASTLREVA